MLARFNDRCAARRSCQEPPRAVASGHPRGQTHAWSVGAHKADESQVRTACGYTLCCPSPSFHACVVESEQLLSRVAVPWHLCVDHLVTLIPKMYRSNMLRSGVQRHLPEAAFEPWVLFDALLGVHNMSLFEPKDNESYRFECVTTMSYFLIPCFALHTNKPAQAP